MKEKRTVAVIWLLLTAAILMSTTLPASARPPAQQPTGSIPTVTGSPSGPMVTVRAGGEEQINVRSGPATTYDAIGVLLIGQSAPALGRTPGGLWILIAYPGVAEGKGWVYAPFVEVSPGELPIVEPPPEPTPAVTATIDPTMAAQFIVTVMPTSLPTFTNPAPLVVPTFANASGSGTGGGIPMVLVILSIAAVGILLGVFYMLQRR